MPVAGEAPGNATVREWGWRHTFSRQKLELLWQLVRPYGRYAYYLLRPGRRPAYFDAPWQYRTCPLSRNAISELQLAAPAPDRRVFIFYPMVDWHVRFQRSQQLARALASVGHTCIYVNPQLGYEYRAPYLFDSRPRIGVLPDGVLELHVHLPREHESHRRTLTADEVSRVVAAVREIIEIRGVRNAVQLTSFPRWLDVAKTIKDLHGFPILYDCHDYLPGFGRISAEIIRQEESLFEQADHVVFSSEYLRGEVIARWPAVGPKSSLVKNGANPADFTAARLGTAQRKAPVIGYAGALDSWFDVDLLLHAACKHKEYRFQLLGRIEDRRVLRLQDCPNVEFVGEVPYGAIPEYMKSWNAAIIPFLNNSVTDSTDAIKLYEYFSAGLPVVCTRLPQMRPYRDLVYIGEDAKGFSSCLAEAVAEADPALRDLRVATAKQESWARRAESLLAACRNLSPAEPVTGNHAGGYACGGFTPDPQRACSSNC
jgi:glycosyltransferase involved in cell wall biosynthesis